MEVIENPLKRVSVATQNPLSAVSESQKSVELTGDELKSSIKAQMASVKLAPASAGDDGDDDSDDELPDAPRGRSQTFNVGHRKAPAAPKSRTSVGASGATEYAKWSSDATNSLNGKGRARQLTNTDTRKNFIEDLYESNKSGPNTSPTNLVPTNLVPSLMRGISAQPSKPRTQLFDTDNEAKDDEHMNDGNGAEEADADGAGRASRAHSHKAEDTAGAGSDSGSCCSCGQILANRCGLMMRLLRTVAAFPFAIVLCSLSLRLHPKYGRKMLYLLNGCVFAVPFVIVDRLSSIVFEQRQLKREGDTSYGFNFGRQTAVCICAFMCFFLLPVVVKISRQVNEVFSFDRVGLGSFCFRPSYGFRWNRANILTIGGILWEWFQHSLYCLPVDFTTRMVREILGWGVTGHNQANGQGLPMNPYEDVLGISFAVVFWSVMALVAFNFIMVVLRLTLVGRRQHRFAECWQLWLIVYYINGPLFVSIVTILSQGLVCVYERDTPPVLLFSPSIECWVGESEGESSDTTTGDSGQIHHRIHNRIISWWVSHPIIAVLSMWALALYVPHATLLPSGTYKETMRNPSLDILFTPVYLQAHFFLKAIFAMFYVWYPGTDHDWFKLPILTLINLLCLLLNYYVEPCPTHSVNTMRNAAFAGAVWAGVSACTLLANEWFGEQSDFSYQWGEGNANGGGGGGAGNGGVGGRQWELEQEQERQRLNDVLLLSWLTLGWVVIGLGAALYHLRRSGTSHHTTEYELAKAFLELEFQMKRTNETKPIGYAHAGGGNTSRDKSKGDGNGNGGNDGGGRRQGQESLQHGNVAQTRRAPMQVHPRVLEPLVSLTLLRAHYSSGSSGSSGSGKGKEQLQRPKPLFLLLRELNLGLSADTGTGIDTEVGSFGYHEEPFTPQHNPQEEWTVDLWAKCADIRDSAEHWVRTMELMNASAADVVEAGAGAGSKGAEGGETARAKKKAQPKPRLKHVAASAVDFLKHVPVRKNGADSKSDRDSTAKTLNGHRLCGWMVYVLIGDDDADDSCTWGVWAGDGKSAGLHVESAVPVRVEREVRVTASYDGQSLRLFLDGAEVGCSQHWASANSVNSRGQEVFSATGGQMIARQMTLIKKKTRRAPGRDSGTGSFAFRANTKSSLRIGVGHEVPAPPPAASKSAQVSDEGLVPAYDWKLVPFAGTIRNPQIFGKSFTTSELAYPQQVELAEKYIPLCIDVLGYDNLRVQFQACWALANLASVGERQCEAIRLARDGMGLAALLETSRASSDIGLKLESLAALVNVAAARSCHAELMALGAAHHLVDQLTASHGQAARFAAMGIANLASGLGPEGDAHRLQLLHEEGVFAPLFNLLMSSDFGRQRHACLALANLAFAPIATDDGASDDGSAGTLKLFCSRALLEQVLKLALGDDGPSILGAIGNVMAVEGAHAAAAHAAAAARNISNRGKEQMHNIATQATNIATQATLLATRGTGGVVNGRLVNPSPHHSTSASASASASASKSASASSSASPAQLAAASLLALLSFHTPVVKALARCGGIQALAYMQRSRDAGVRRLAYLASNNCTRVDTGKRRKRGGSVCLAHTPYVKASAKPEPEQAAGAAGGGGGGRAQRPGLERVYESEAMRVWRYMRPTTTAVTWRDWGSQLDRLKLVQEKPPVAGYQHIRISANERAEVKLMAGGRATTSEGVSLRFEIVRMPRHGALDLTKLHTHHTFAYIAFKETTWELLARQKAREKRAAAAAAGNEDEDEDEDEDEGKQVNGRSRIRTLSRHDAAAETTAHSDPIMEDVVEYRVDNGFLSSNTGRITFVIVPPEKEGPY